MRKPANAPIGMQICLAMFLILALHGWPALADDGRTGEDFSSLLFDSRDVLKDFRRKAQLQGCGAKEALDKVAGMFQTQAQFGAGNTTDPKQMRVWESGGDEPRSIRINWTRYSQKANGGMIRVNAHVGPIPCANRPPNALYEAWISFSLPVYESGGIFRTGNPKEIQIETVCCRQLKRQTATMAGMNSELFVYSFGTGKVLPRVGTSKPPPKPQPPKRVSRPQTGSVTTAGRSGGRRVRTGGGSPRPTTGTVGTGAATAAQPKPKPEPYTMENPGDMCAKAKALVDHLKTRLQKLETEKTQVDKDLKNNQDRQGQLDTDIDRLEDRLEKQQGVGGESRDSATGTVYRSYDDGKGNVIVTRQRPGEAEPTKIDEYKRESTKKIEAEIAKKKNEKNNLKNKATALKNRQKALTEAIGQTQARLQDALAKLAACVDDCNAKQGLVSEYGKQYPAPPPAAAQAVAAGAAAAGELAAETPVPGPGQEDKTISEGVGDAAAAGRSAAGAAIGGAASEAATGADTSGAGEAATPRATGGTDDKTSARGTKSYPAGIEDTWRVSLGANWGLKDSWQLKGNYAYENESWSTSDWQHFDFKVRYNWQGGGVAKDFVVDNPPEHVEVLEQKGQQLYSFDLRGYLAFKRNPGMTTIDPPTLDLDAPDDPPASSGIPAPSTDDPYHLNTGDRARLATIVRNAILTRGIRLLMAGYSPGKAGWEVLEDYGSPGEAGAIIGLGIRNRAIIRGHFGPLNDIQAAFVAEYAFDIFDRYDDFDGIFTADEVAEGVFKAIRAAGGTRQQAITGARGARLRWQMPTTIGGISTGPGIIIDGEQLGESPPFRLNQSFIRYTFNHKIGVHMDETIPRVEDGWTVNPVLASYVRPRKPKETITPNDPLYQKRGAAAAAGSALKKGLGFALRALGSSVQAEEGADDQWGLPATGFKPRGEGSAWDIEDGSRPNVTVAVIDSGLDFNHPDRPRHLWVNRDEIPDNGKDDDGNGYVDDIHGWNFHGENNDLQDNYGHGTFVAGIIAANTNNAEGIAGVNPGARIMVLKITKKNGDTNSLAIYRAIRYAVDNGARVLNISFGGKEVDALEQIGINYAYAMGCIVVVAAGNESSDIAKYGPPGSRRAFSVASMNMDGNRRGASNKGLKVALAAPGESVYSLTSATGKRDGKMLPIAPTDYHRLNGTSFAAPFVTGTASLLWARNPELTNHQVEDLMLYTAGEMEEPGWDVETGAGRLDAYQALAQDPARILVPRITEYRINREKRKITSVDVFGSVRGNLENYIVEVGRGDDPDKWQTVFGPSKYGVDQGFICRIDGKYFQKGSKWSVRIVAVSPDGESRTQQVLVAKK